MRVAILVVLAGAMLSASSALACNDHDPATVDYTPAQLAQLQASADQLILLCEQGSLTPDLCVSSNIRARCLYAAEQGAPSELCEQRGYR